MKKPKQLKYFKPYILYTCKEGKEMIWCPPFDSKKTMKGTQGVVKQMLKELERDKATPTYVCIKEIVEIFHEVGAQCSK